MIPLEVIDLMQRREKRFKPTVLKLPRSEDMRSVVAAELSASDGVIINFELKDPLTSYVDGLRDRLHYLKSMQRKTWVFVSTI